MAGGTETTILLVRHGESTDNVERRLGSLGPGAPLTDRGRAQASALALRLATRDVAAVYVSPLFRARQTAEILAAATGAPIAENPDLAPGRSTGRDILAWARSEGAGVALVGHNPEMAEAVALAAGHGGKLPPGSVAAVDLTESGATLAWIEAADKE